MTPMALPYAYPSTRRAEPAGTAPARWRLFGAGFAIAVVVDLGPAAVRSVHLADHGVVTAAAAPGAVLVGAETRLVAVQPSIISW